MSIQTHDYIRYDTITLSKALHYLNGKKIYRTERKHTHVKWLHLVKQVGREVPKGNRNSPDRRQFLHAQA